METVSGCQLKKATVNQHAINIPEEGATQAFEDVHTLPDVLWCSADIAVTMNQSDVVTVTEPLPTESAETVTRVDEFTTPTNLNHYTANAVVTSMAQLHLATMKEPVLTHTAELFTGKVTTPTHMKKTAPEFHQHYSSGLERNYTGILYTC